MKEYLILTLMALCFVTTAQAITISIGDTGNVTDTWNPAKEANRRLQLVKPSEDDVRLTEAVKENKTLLDKNWFIFKETYFMSISNKVCDHIKPGDKLRVTNILIFNTGENRTSVDTAVNFITEKNENCLTFAVDQ